VPDTAARLPAYLRADEAALAYGITVAEVYRLASEHRWRRFRWCRHVHYRHDDIRDTMAELGRVA
jgi:hypothetical protein